MQIHTHTKRRENYFQSLPLERWEMGLETKHHTGALRKYSGQQGFDGDGYKMLLLFYDVEMDTRL